MKASVEFRREAEERALKIKLEKESKDREVTAIQAAYTLQSNKQTFQDAASGNGMENTTPRIAALAEVDYKLNGGRARSNTGEFVPPRWIPDEETKFCFKCRGEFDWVNRRHHCRHCGHILCGECSKHRALLPVAFGERDPQRVCDECEKVLRPYQLQLTHTIANHACANSIDVADGPCTRRYFNLPYANTLAGEVRKAAYTTHNLFTMDWIRDKSIPLQLLQDAKGLAFLTVVKAGLGFAVRLGTGLVVARLPDGSWSAPSAISTVGCNWGFLVGADVTDYVVILNTTDAVEAFSGAGQVSIGAGIDVALGPLGREVSGSFNVGTKGYAPAYSYSHSRGAYVGVGLEGSLIMSRSSINFNFYGQELDPADILRGSVPPPRAAQPLYDALFHASGENPNGSYSTSYSMTGSGDAVEKQDLKAGGFTQGQSPTKGGHVTPYKEMANDGRNGIELPTRAVVSGGVGTIAGSVAVPASARGTGGRPYAADGAGFYAEDETSFVARNKEKQVQLEMDALSGGMF